MGRACSIHGVRNAYNISVEKPKGKGQLCGPRHRWEDNIKMDLKETGCETEFRIHLVQDRTQ